MSSAHQALPQVGSGLLAKGRFGRDCPTPGVTLTEVSGFAAAIITARRGEAAAVVRALHQSFGLGVVDAPRRVASGSLSVTGIAPGQWLVIARDRTDTDLATDLSRALTGQATLTEQGSGRMIVELGGPKARAALAKGVPVDLDPRVFAVTSAAQTVAGHIGLGLALVDERPCFEIVSTSSTRTSFLTWLLSSSAEFGIAIV